jgi:hypothetical protein
MTPAQSTEEVRIPSKGLVYDANLPHSVGTIELKYPTLAEEDILMSPNLLRQGIAVKKFVQSLIVSPEIKVENLVLGDYNTLAVAARIMAYGPSYGVKVGDTVLDLDLNNIATMDIKEELLVEKHKNLFQFTLSSGTVIQYRLRTMADDEIFNKTVNELGENEKRPEMTMRYIQSIVSVDGVTSPVTVSKFVYGMKPMESKEFREHLAITSPGISDMIKTTIKGREVSIPFRLGPDFFWP